MPSMDVVSEIDQHEVSNAVDQANREVATRFDFKGTDSRFEQEKLKITLHSGSDFQLQQMLDIFQGKLTKRGVDIRCMDIKDPVVSGKTASQETLIKEGIETEVARKIVKAIKESKLKVQAAIQGDQVRVSGKKRDDLQQTIAMLKELKLDVPLQFTNFRD